jgi:hypothetical protein
MSPKLPLPPPKDAAGLERLIEWVASVPRARRKEIREVIGGLSGRADVTELLHEALFSLPCTDLGRHGLLLSMIGELADASSLPALERFVWLSDEALFGPEMHRQYGACDFSPSGMLQARAAEMLAWVARGEHEGTELRIVLEHPSSGVRVAAIDAYLFQRDDAPDVIAALSERVRPEDAWAVGLPRRFDGMDVEQFDRLVAEHGARHGSVPPPPQQGGQEGGHVH